jgi:hypothetical protein
VKEPALTLRSRAISPETLCSACFLGERGHAERFREYIRQRSGNTGPAFSSVQGDRLTNYRIDKDCMLAVQPALFFLSGDQQGIKNDNSLGPIE